MNDILLQKRNAEAARQALEAVNMRLTQQDKIIAELRALLLSQDGRISALEQANSKLNARLMGSGPTGQKR